MKLLKILFLSLSFSAFLMAPVLATTTEIIFKPQVPIPNNGVKDEGLDFSKPVNFSNYNSLKPLGEYIKYIMKYIIGICAILGTIMMMMGGFKYVLSQGDSGMIKDAQDTIFSAFIGIILAASSYLILATVNTDLVNFKATNISVVKAIGCCPSTKANKTCGYVKSDECSVSVVEKFICDPDGKAKCVDSTDQTVGQKLTSFIKTYSKQVNN